MIPYGKQTIEQDDIQAVVDVLKSDFLTTGPKIAEFEQTVADYVGAKYAVAISKRTHLLFMQLALRQGLNREMRLLPHRLRLQHLQTVYCIVAVHLYLLMLIRRLTI